MKPTLVTGNEHKAKYFSDIIGMDIPHQSADVDEIQSLNLTEIVTYKAKQAFELLQRPVIVEDTKLTITAMGALPGPFIKWFLEELGAEGICKLVDGFSDRTAIAGAAIAYFDGETLEIFEKELLGEIVTSPRGDSGFGWNVIFKPHGSPVTLGEMSETDFLSWYKKVKPFDQLREFLLQLEHFKA